MTTEQLKNVQNAIVHVQVALALRITNALNVLIQQFILDKL
jgi:hypothetical protein